MSSPPSSGMPHVASGAGLLLLSVALSGCGLFGGGGGEGSCTSLQVEVNRSEAFVVTYSLSVSGDATAGRVTYRTDQGRQQVSDPTQAQSPDDAWSTTVQVQADTTPQARADVDAQDGSVELRLDAMSGDTRIERVESCGAETN